MSSIDRAQLSTFAGNMKNSVESMGSVAYSLGILALNANIEALHAAEFIDSFDSVVSENLLIQARLLMMIYESCETHKDYTLLEELTDCCSVGNIHIAYNSGEIVYSNVGGTVGRNLFNLYDINSYRRKDRYLEIILKNKTITDDEIIKSVLISSRDTKYLLVLDFVYHRSKGIYTINSFNVIANEIRRQSKDFENLTREVKAACDKILDISTNSQDMECGELHYICREELLNLKRILQIADITNLLAIRARIEAAQSSNDVSDFDNMLNTQMVAQARVCRHLIPSGEMTYEDAQALADKTGIDEFWVTDANGRVEITNSIGGKEFTFTNNGQTAVFMPLLKQENGVVTSPPAVRAIDGKVYKFVGVSRLGGGILQIGRKAEIYGQSTATGFTIVAQQVKTMAEESKETISDMIEQFNNIMNETKQVIC